MLTQEQQKPGLARAQEAAEECAGHAAEPGEGVVGPAAGPVAGSEPGAASAGASAGGLAGKAAAEAPASAVAAAVGEGPVAYGLWA